MYPLLNVSFGTIQIKCQPLFSRKIRKHLISRLLKILPSMLNVKIKSPEGYQISKNKTKKSGDYDK